MSQENVKQKIDVMTFAAPAQQESLEQAHSENIVSKVEEILNSREQMIYFYTGRDCTRLQKTNMKKLRDLQDLNDSLQRQLLQLEKDIASSDDSLTLLAEKERLQIILSRNAGEMLEIQIDNEKRLDRIVQLEEENARLRKQILQKRDDFIGSHDLNLRTQCATNFFLIKTQIERNTEELRILTQE